jgi:hypothetical protein
MKKELSSETRLVLNEYIPFVRTPTKAFVKQFFFIDENERIILPRQARDKHRLGKAHQKESTLTLFGQVNDWCDCTGVEKLCGGKVRQRHSCATL